MSVDCYHCGDEVIGRGYEVDEKKFCCNGCKSVFLLLNENGLDSFYTLEKGAGSKPKSIDVHKYDFLEVPEIKERFIGFEDDKSIHITFFLPKIHCSSCIYLLENLHKIEPAVLSSITNFTKREATIIFQKDQLKLSELALLLDRIGYAPNFEDRTKVNAATDKQFLYKLGVAGFAFGSIMLWSFPEYLGIEQTHEDIRNFTSYLSFFVSVPVLLYSANEYWISAFKALRYKRINIDVPISLGIVALYAQSCYHIFSGSGPGYMDSFAGFIFFLLIGKWFQKKTYKSLSFDRDHRSYFPVAVIRVVGNQEEIVEIDKIKEGDELLIRNDEIIPCEAILQSDRAQIDYSFVTGESAIIEVKKGEMIYAGGRLIGQRTRFLVKYEPKRSRLTALWNAHEASTKEISDDKLSVHFLIIILSIASATAITWFFLDTSFVVETAVAVLIVACPCALALSRPFTYGNTMRKLGRKGLYLKNATVIEDINEITDVVFDKTGTLTKGSQEKVRFEGSELTQHEIESIALIAQSSTHPLSRSIVQFLLQKNTISEAIELTEFQEESGRGMQGKVNGVLVKVGSASFVGSTDNHELETASFVQMNGEIRGKFIFQSELREGVSEVIEALMKSKKVHVLSGDSEKDLVMLQAKIPHLTTIKFKQSPQDKHAYIQELQAKGAKVMMIGDGLNDAGALIAADVGVAISEDVFHFTPSSNAILEANSLNKLTQLIGISNYAKTVLKTCIVFSILYNIVGLSFAVTGNLTPLIAAILMPISSITVVIISTLLVTLKK